VGKTAGRGHLGQGQHAGNVRPGFEGGQTPLYRRLRKYGFTNARFSRSWGIVNLDRLQQWIDSGRIDNTKKITMKELLDSGCCGKLRKDQQGVKLLGNVSFSSCPNLPNLNYPISPNLSQSKLSQFPQSKLSHFS